MIFYQEVFEEILKDRKKLVQDFKAKPGSCCLFPNPANLTFIADRISENGFQFLRKSF